MARSETRAKLGKVVRISGASSGIGRATAEHLASCGHRVFAGARRLPLGMVDGAIRKSFGL